MASLIAQLSSLLLVSNRPLKERELAKFTQRPSKQVREVLTSIAAFYNKEDLGIKIIQHNGEFQMVSDPGARSIVETFLKEELSGELTKAQLEVLTIILYRGPIKKSEIELIRGVHSGLVLKNLLMRGLIEESTKDIEKIYIASMDCMKLLGISLLNELPEYNELSKHELIEGLLSRQPIESTNV